jgi:hypothetical protein
MGAFCSKVPEEAKKIAKKYEDKEDKPAAKKDEPPAEKKDDKPAEAEPDNKAEADSPPPSPQPSPRKVSHKPKKTKNPLFKLDGPAGLRDEAAAEREALFDGDGYLFKEAAKAGGGAAVWTFYNDTADREMTVKYTFSASSEVAGLASTEVTQEDGGKTTMVLKIPPGETAPFMEGTPNGYSSSFGIGPLSEETKAAMRAESQAVVDRETAAVVAIADGCGGDAEKTLAACVEQRVPFVDLAFPPVEATLWRRGVDEEAVDHHAFARPTRYLPADQAASVALIRAAEPNDIHQGSLGDCWLCCAMSALAEMPARVKHVFAHPVAAAVAKCEQTVGAYRVTLNVDGWWAVVVVDDLLPVRGAAPVFARNADDPAELWVSVIEKAFAKAHGSYSALIGGDALYALQCMTGFPTAALTGFEEAGGDGALSDKAFGNLLGYDDAGHLLSVSTPGGAAALTAKYDEVGLCLGHAHSILTVVEVPDIEGETLRLVQIRNPWGNGKEWAGAWCDGDDRWERFPEVARKCAFTGPCEDGTFWMPWGSVTDFFATVGVCYAQRGWHDVRVRDEFRRGIPAVCLEVVCRRRTECFVLLSQGGPRTGHKPASVLLSVCRVAAGGAGEVLANSNFNEPDEPLNTKLQFMAARHVWVRYTFEPSDAPYYIIPRAFDAEVNCDFVVGLLASKAVGPGAACGLAVTARTLSSDTAIFKNHSAFDVAAGDGREAHETVWQSKAAKEAPVDSTGSVISSA